MKKYRYVVAATCLLLSAAGFIGLYATDDTEDKDELAKNQNIVEESEDLILGSNIFDTEDMDDDIENQIAEIDSEANLEPEDAEEIAQQDQIEKDTIEQDSLEDETPVGTVTQEALHFRPEDGIVWPIEGAVLLDYSMESTIFFPTLQQYQYNPAMVISGKVNQKVYFIAKGKITDISTNEETGCTVTQDLGDGYAAVYGQLKELNFDVGDMVESGQVVGYVGEPTKYYSVEGSNIYFQILKDGKPLDPKDVLPEKQ